jgi:hypothetical protein
MAWVHYVVLSSELSAAYRLPEEPQVTGDAGYHFLERPAAVPPGRDVLQAKPALAATPAPSPRQS